MHTRFWNLTKCTLLILYNLLKMLGPITKYVLHDGVINVLKNLVNQMLKTRKQKKLNSHLLL